MYHFQFSFQAASPEIFGYTVVYLLIMFYYCINICYSQFSSGVFIISMFRRLVGFVMLKNLESEVMLYHVSKLW
jgi:hypothetical protein